jgi:hypothetical protein
MKTIFIVIILSSIITSSIIFAIVIQSNSYFFPKEHYEIEITGMKDVYLVGEPYSFGYIISGYGNSCGNQETYFPDENGDTAFISIDVSCIANNPIQYFEFHSRTLTGSEFEQSGIKNPGMYGVSVMYEHGAGFEPTQGGQGFHVVEKICDDIDAKTEAQCFVESFESCKSSYIQQRFYTVEGDPIIVTGIVERWNDCKLRVYMDTTHDMYGGHSTGILRSICEEITVSEKSWQIENCSNFDLPSLLYNLQDGESK